MDRYIIRIVRDSVPEHPSRPTRPAPEIQGFTKVFQGRCFSLYTTTSTAVEMLGPHPVVGRVFQRNQETDLRHASRSDGFLANLSQTLWGSYVAVYDTISESLSVYRDPSGALPCYYVETPDLITFASDVEALQAAGQLTASVNWDYIGQHVWSGYLRTPETGLKGVHELRQGWAASITASGVDTREIWSPWTFTQNNGRSVEENARALRSVINDCVGVLIKPYDTLHLGLSGGLDSSLLACSLKASGVSAHAYTMITDEAVGNESCTAKLAADSLGHRLTQIPYALEDVDLTRSQTAHLPRPVGFAYQSSMYKYWKTCDASAGPSAILTGNGGDEVFCLMHSATPAVDLWMGRHSPHRTLNALLDVCQLTGCTLLAAATQALQTWHRRKAPYAWRQQDRFLKTRLVSDNRDRTDSTPSHPWLTAPPGTLPGKKVHVANLLKVQPFVEGRRRTVRTPVLFPLLAQPVVELCLQIPTWQWSHGGYNRFVARTAFADSLPVTLFDRQDKGGPEAFAAQVYQANRKALIPFLTEGLLAHNDIIDIDAVKRALAIDAPPRGFDYLRLLELADAEAWTRHYEKGSQG